MPSSEIYCVFQDSKGFVWFGSDAGVSKFDGYTFKNYTTEDGLADNVVFEIKEDRHNRIWFRSLSGKLCYINNDVITKIEVNKIISQNMKNALMTSFYIDSGDTLWCGLTLGSGYFKISSPYRKEDFKVIKINKGVYSIEIENNNFISGSYFYGQKREWPIVSFYEKQNLKREINIFNPKASTIFYSKVSLNDGLISGEERLCRITKDTAHVLLNKSQIFNARIIFLKKTGSNQWLGLLNRGVIKCFEKDELTWKKTEHILDGYSVSDVMVDNEGGTWFTTLENGVYYSSLSHFVFYKGNNGFSDYTNYAVEKIDTDVFFMSNQLDRVSIITYDSIKQNVAISDKKVLNLLKYTESSVLINTGNNLKLNNYSGYLWDRNSHRLKKIHDSLGTYSSVYQFANNNEKNYLFTRHWIFTLHGNAKHTTTSVWLPSRVLSLYQSKKGIIWLGCMNGLWSWENERFIYHGNESDYLKNAIEDIKEDFNGTTYYATRGNGILVCKDGKYSKITTANGLSSNNCKCLYIDKNNTIWVGAKNEICQLKKEVAGWRVLKFDLTNDEYSYEVFRIDKIKNKLIVFTNKGILYHQLDNDEIRNTPRIYLTQFSANDTSYIEDSSKVLNYNQNFIKISYIGLSYKSMGKIYYSYKLDGLDTNWHITQNLSLQYPFLPSGSYTFHVRAISFNGEVSKEPVAICFTIKKPFWKTLWFIISVVTVGISLLYLLFYYRLKQIKKREIEKTIFNKQLAELEMKALRSQMNPHFIFNAINSIQNYIVKKDNKTAQDYLAKFAHLIRDVLENSKQENISLSKEVETLKLYIELEQLRARNSFTVDLIVLPGLNLHSVSIPPLILQPYVENAILHGLAPLTNKQGKLMISLENMGNKLICIIDDNGVGRKKASELKQKKQFIHKSIGLSITEDRINIINKVRLEESFITIKDKLNEYGDAFGTTVTIVINISK